VSILLKFGFYVRRQTGSHIILRKNNPFHQVVVPNHKILDKGTLRAILRQADITIDKFNKYI
jgi:predicted RNA binding protein YcfA (HicA-like mRNA interferase family)